MIRFEKRRLAAGMSLLCIAAASLEAATPGAQADPPGLFDLVQVTDLSGLAASPDGRHVAFRSDRALVDRNSYALTWRVVDLVTGTVREVGGGGEPILADPGRVEVDTPVWSPDGAWIYYRALDKGGIQIWRAAADGTASQTVTAEEGDILSLELAQDGKGIAYRVEPPRDRISRAELSEYDAGILVDGHVELGQNLFRGGWVNGRLASQRLTGQWFQRGGIFWNEQPSAKRLDFADLAVSAAAPETLRPEPALEIGSTRISVSARSPTGDVAAASWDGAQGRLEARRAGEGGKIIACSAEICSSRRIVWLAWRPGTDQILLATAERSHDQVLHLWDLSSGSLAPLARSDGLLNGGRYAASPCAVAQDAAVCVSASPASPPRLERVDLETGARAPLFDPNAQMRALSWPTVRKMSWRGRSGRTFTGTLFLPRDALPERLPLFINYYRCEGFLRGGVGDEWPFVALASAGMAAMCVNAVPMSGPQDGVGQYRAALEGIKGVIDLLAAEGTVDTKRVGIGGLSFGSEVAMWAVTHSDLIAAASIASPQFEPSNYWFNGVRGRDHHEHVRQVWGLGTPDETPERWRLLSPALNVERIRAPLLLQLPEQEARYAVELYARLSQSNTPAELYVFPDEPHVKVQPRHRLAVYRRNLDWFRFWLMDVVDEDPTRADQYRRWETLADRAGRGKASARERSQSSSETRSKIRK